MEQDKRSKNIRNTNKQKWQFSLVYLHLHYLEGCAFRCLGFKSTKKFQNYCTPEDNERRAHARKRENTSDVSWKTSLVSNEPSILSQKFCLRRAKRKWPLKKREKGRWHTELTNVFYKASQYTCIINRLLLHNKHVALLPNYVLVFFFKCSKN